MRGRKNYFSFGEIDFFFQTRKSTFCGKSQNFPRGSKKRRVTRKWEIRLPMKSGVLCSLRPDLSFAVGNSVKNRVFDEKRVFFRTWRNPIFYFLWQHAKRSPIFWSKIRFGARKCVWPKSFLEWKRWHVLLSVTPNGKKSEHDFDEIECFEIGCFWLEI